MCKTKCIHIFQSVLLLINFHSIVSLRLDAEWKSYSEDGLPPLFLMEDYSKCAKQQDTFCKIEITITPNDLNSMLAAEIEISHNTYYRFFRSFIYRMMCIPKENMNTVMVKDFIERVAEKELKEYNVTIQHTKYICNVNRVINFYDYLMCALLVAYAWVLYKSTSYDTNRRKNPKYPISKYDKYFNTFSIRRIWENINAKNTNPDFQRLKAIQGIRVFNIILVIACQTKMVISVLFLTNPQDWEKIFSSKILTYILQMDAFIIQFNLMTSTFLLTNYIYEFHKKQGYFSLTQCFIMFFNRILRFLPTLGIYTLLLLPITKLLPQGASSMDVFNLNWDNTIRNWWATLLQMNYFYTFSEQCMPGTWYLAVDSFLFLTTILVLYFQLKYKMDPKKILLICFIGTTFLFGYIIYSNDLDFMYKMTMEAVRRTFESPEFQLLYISPFSSWNTCFVGIAMGAVYFHTKNKKITLYPVWEVIWLLTFLLVPLLVVHVSTYEYEGITRAIVGPLLKPTFALGLGIGILGMANSLGGIIKKLLEWEFIVKMSNFTYCIYLIHFPLVYSRGVHHRELFHVEWYHIVTFIFQDIIVSFLCGILFTLTIEHPGLSLQKMLVLQILKPKYDAVEENKNRINQNTSTVIANGDKARNDKGKIIKLT